MFNESRKPVLIAGIEIHRFKASHDLVELAEKMGAPVLTTVLGKGAFPMDHPLYMGVHVARSVRHRSSSGWTKRISCSTSDVSEPT